MGNAIPATPTELSVLGDELTAGELALVYSWSVLGVHPGAVLFSSNGSNTAKNTTATFGAPGDYLLQATITNPTTGLSTVSLLEVQVSPPIAFGLTAATANSLDLSQPIADETSRSSEILRYAFSLFAETPQQDAQQPLAAPASDTTWPDDALLLPTSNPRRSTPAIDAEDLALGRTPDRSPG